MFQPHHTLSKQPSRPKQTTFGFNFGCDFLLLWTRAQGENKTGAQCTLFGGGWATNWLREAWQGEELLTSSIDCSTMLSSATKLSSARFVGVPKTSSARCGSSTVSPLWWWSWWWWWWWWWKRRILWLLERCWNTGGDGQCAKNYGKTVSICNRWEMKKWTE